jgi:hypothetical protein
MTEQNCSKSWSVGSWKSRNVDIRHAETADARRLVRQCLLMGVEPQVDDVTDAESVDIGQLRLGRLAGCRYSIIETTPVMIVSGSAMEHSYLEEAQAVGRVGVDQPCCLYGVD